MKLIEACEDPHILRVLLIVKYLLIIIVILIPIIIIFTTIQGAIKIAISGRSEDVKDFLKQSVRKVVAGLIILCLPSLITYLFSLLEEPLYELNYCKNNINIETIKYYEKLLPVKYSLEKVEMNPTATNLEQAQRKVEEASSFANEESMMDYLQRLSSAEQKVNEYQDKLECRAKNGTYKDGYCLLPPKPNKEENGNISFGTGGSGTTIDVNVLNENYTVIQTPISVSEYVNLIKKAQIAETKDLKVYSDHCLPFAYIHSYSLFSGDASARAEDALEYKYASKFKGYDNDSKEDVLEKVYNEIINGRPCLIQVNGNKKGTSRHYVSVVGFKNSVKNAKALTEEDLLIIDSYDGKLERMDTETSRFMITGAACHKKYSGYQMYYIK